MKTGAPWRWMPNDLPPWRAVYRQTQRWRAAGCFEQLADDLLTPADSDDRAQVGRLAEAVQATTGDGVDLAYIDQGYTGEKPAKAAREHGIEREVVNIPGGQARPSS